jgi:hypothetical protein
MGINDTVNVEAEIKFPEDGQKVIFKRPLSSHWFKNIIDDQVRYLAINQEYTVRKTQLNSSSSFVWLEELRPYNKEQDLPFFSLCAFDWEGKPKSSVEEQKDLHIKE